MPGDMSWMKERYLELSNQSLLWEPPTLESPNQPRCNMDGKPTIMLSANNYLNLTTHPKVMNAMIEATKKYGAGSGSSWRGLCMTSQEAAGEYKQGLACPPLVDTSHNTTSVLTYKPQIIGHSSGYGTHLIISGHSAENAGGYATRVITRMILEERSP